MLFGIIDMKLKKLNLKKFIIILVIVAVIAVEFFWLAKKFDYFGGSSGDLTAENQNTSPSISTPSGSSPNNGTATPSSSQNTSSPSQTLPKSILQTVPFFSQAPFGEWDDPMFQNACEEASIIMAMHWVKKTSVTKEQAKQEIIALTDFEYRTYGEAIDRAAKDAIKMFKDYYNYENVSLRSGIGAADIKAEILKGNLVIVPLNGRILKNPYYTAPGPEHHMLVVIGYDGKTDEFITNDVGTRHGEKYRYASSRLEAALIDYPTGDDLPAPPGKTVMIVVMPK
jgi:hypothetical protein